MKNFLCGLLLATVGLLVMGHSSLPSSPGQYQMATSHSFPDVYVLNTETGELYRYAFANPRTSGTRSEVVFVESFGTPKEPEHKNIIMLNGKEWPSGYSY